MKSIFTFFAAIALTALTAQTFNSAESVEYDDANNRWLVDDNGAGTIVSMYPQSSSTAPFASGPTSGPHGIEILNGVAYVCDGGFIRGYDLASGTNVFNLNLSASFLNGLTTDGTTYLFATDFSSGQKKVYRINPAANAFNLMCTTIKQPNGIYYDGANNRLVFVTWGSNAPIQAVSLLDSTISTLTTTTYGNFDGITRDNAGYWYATSYSGNTLIRWSPTFTTPTVVMTGLNAPADIDINTAGDSIAIPNSGGSTVVFYTNITTGIATLSTIGFNLYPNPASTDCNVTFGEMQNNSEAILTDVRGRVVRDIRFSGTNVLLNRGDLEAGIYLLKIVNENGEMIGTDKIIFE
ncbi:MAG: T9SS type A sorting domain-containing protein [Bacteroidota bacterium]|nr:T9SS type A sorting domain-containing protein [Bacteroidota bacterium]